MFLYALLLLLTFLACASGELPTELDPFLEKLFDTEECEEFLGAGDFLSVATVECDPYKCDFPRQLCMRPSAQYQDKSANMCKDLPAKCLTAANGGVPVGPPTIPTLPPLPTFPPMKPIVPGPFPSLGGGPGGGPGAGSRAGPGGGGLGMGPDRVAPHARKIVNPNNVRPRDICEMGAPTGRFCGFAQKFVYNRETGECDEFWFPGCRTAETNANLFDTRRQCERVADVCARLATPAPVPVPVPVPRPHRPQPPQPPPGPPPGIFPGGFLPGGGGEGGPRVGPGGMFGGRGAGGNQGGALGGEGGEEGANGNNGLLGLITQGLMTAKQLKEGGNGAIPQVAAQQAQNWLSQFGFDGIPNFFGAGG